MFKITKLVLIYKTLMHNAKQKCIFILVGLEHFEICILKCYTGSRCELSLNCCLC